MHSDHNRRLDIRVARARAGFDGIVYDCKGPEHVIGGMDGEVGIVHPDWGAEAWEVVRVVPVDVGDVKSLWSVRQAYQVFTEQMVQWGERNRRMSP